MVNFRNNPSLRTDQVDFDPGQSGVTVCFLEISWVVLVLDLQWKLSLGQSVALCLSKGMQNEFPF